MSERLTVTIPGYLKRRLEAEMPHSQSNKSEYVQELLSIGLEAKAREKLLKMAQNRKEDVAALSKPGYSAPAVNYNGDHGIYLTRYTPPLW